MFRRFLALSIIATLSACTLPPETAPSTIGPDEGLLVLSIGEMRGTRSSTYSITYESTDGRRRGTLVWSGADNLFGQKPEYIEPGTQGQIFVKALPSGHYVLSKFTIGTFVAGLALTIPRVATLDTNSTTTASSAPAITVPFNISPGETTYTGSFIGVVRTSDNRFGRSVNEQYFLHADDEKRDIEIARRKTPLIHTVQSQSLPAKAMRMVAPKP
jgi:hypothetical protein